MTASCHFLRSDDMKDKLINSLHHIIDELNYLETIIGETISDIDKEIEKLNEKEKSDNGD